MDEIKLLSIALTTYKEFFGKLPDLYNKEDVDELYSIYADISYTTENITERIVRKQATK